MFTIALHRLVKHAIEKRKPVLVLNIGPTRAHELAGIEIIELPAGAILREVVKRVLYVHPASTCLLHILHLNVCPQRRYGRTGPCHLEVTYERHCEDPAR